MKKLLLIALIALGLAAAPALAAAADVTISGRNTVIYSWSVLDDDYTQYFSGHDDGDFSGNAGVLDAGLGAKANSITADAKVSDSLSASITLGMTSSATQPYEEAGFIQAYATWDFGAGKLSFGNMESAGSNFYGFPVTTGVAPWIGMGNVYHIRKPTMQLSFDSFTIAARRNTGGAVGGFTDVDAVIPEIVANYRFGNQNLSLAAAGGFQTYGVEDHVTDESATINAYNASLTSRINMDPAHISIGAFYAVNPMSQGVLQFMVHGSPTVHADGDVDDATVIGGGITGGVNLSSNMALNAGVNHRTSDKDGEDDLDCTAAYVNLKTSMGPISVTPEIGYFDYGDDGDTSRGTQTYFSTVFEVRW